MNPKFNASITVTIAGWTSTLPAVVEITSPIVGDVLHEGNLIFINPDGSGNRGCRWQKDATPLSQFASVVGFPENKKVVIDGHNVTVGANDTLQLGNGFTKVIIQRRWIGSTIGNKGPSGRFAFNSYRIKDDGSTDYRQHIFGTIWNGDTEELHYFFNSWDAPTGVKVLDLPPS